MNYIKEKKGKMKTIFDVEKIDVKKEEPEFKKGNLVFSKELNTFCIFDSVDKYISNRVVGIPFSIHDKRPYYVNKNDIRKPTEKEIEKFFQNEFNKLNKIIKDNNLCILDSDGFVTSLPKTVKKKC